jgi:hypothetical protein
MMALRTVAITPTKSKSIPFDEVKRICQTSTLAGLRAMHEAGLGKPFRFMYMSGFATERDMTKKPAWMPEYTLMRVRRECSRLDISPRTNLQDTSSEEWWYAHRKADCLLTI